MRLVSLLTLCCSLLAARAFGSVSPSSKRLQLGGNALVSRSDAQATNMKQLSTNTNYNVLTSPYMTDSIARECSPMSNATSLTQLQLISLLTQPCRYDHLEPPFLVDATTNEQQPVSVYVRIFIFVLQNPDSNSLQFTLQGLLQLRYFDPRLAFGAYTDRKQPILGESELRNQIWVPHVFIANEETSSILGTTDKDVLTSIQADGTVTISTRFQATLYCWMNFQKFPFDEQRCSTILESWLYNTSGMQLHWEPNLPVSFDPKLQLTEYLLDGFWYNESIVVSDEFNMRHGALAGNYSSLSFTIKVSREVGYYVIEYFIPSIMIVAISWVTFWLQADQTPARTTLGATTMLSFITLSLSQENNLSKVSYITLSEVWFLVCTFFIFLSLVEFAFVNTIWRRSKDVAVKKRKAKYIVKSTFTPNMKRAKDQSNNHSRDANNSKDHKNGNDCSSSSSKGKDEKNTIITIEGPIAESADTVNNLNRSDTPSTASTLNIEEVLVQQCSGGNGLSTPPTLKEKQEPPKPNSWSTMTPREVSLWIDRKMRFVFPLAFILFNALFWTLVYTL